MSRPCATILRELHAACQDYLDACAATEADAEDRATEADQRSEALRYEFANTFLSSTGLTFKQVQTAIEEAVL